jgi:hypothetical protein
MERMETLERRTFLSVNLNFAGGVLTIEGGSGNENVYVSVGSGNMMVVYDQNVKQAQYALASVKKVMFHGNDGNDQLTVSLDPADSLHLSVDVGFDSIVINGGQIHLGAPTIPFIDMATSDATLIFSTSPSNRDSLLSQINQQIRSGRNGGLWNGSGIFSSGAAANEDHILGLAAVGSWQLDPSAGTSDVFIRLVKNGDSDIDGDLDADDYARLDEAWANPPAQSSYFAGDFNYNGRLDSDDFFAIDRAFSQ